MSLFGCRVEMKSVRSAASGGDDATAELRLSFSISRGEEAPPPAVFVSESDSVQEWAALAPKAAGPVIVDPSLLSVVVAPP